MGSKKWSIKPLILKNWFHLKFPEGHSDQEASDEGQWVQQLKYEKDEDNLLHIYNSLYIINLHQWMPNQKKACEEHVTQKAFSFFFSTIFQLVDALNYKWVVILGTLQENIKRAISCSEIVFGF